MGDFDAAIEKFKDFCETVAALRHPQTGCPWDLAQSHASLRRYMVEEAYEAVEVMEPLNSEKLADELGDVLLQVVLNAQVASDEGRFDISDVIANIDAKMKRRHPHVFGDEKQREVRDHTSIKQKWSEIKSQEKIAAKKDGYFESVTNPNTLTPALMTAVEIGKRAKKINFDWTTSNEVMVQVKSELAELDEELLADKQDASRIYEEMGDVLFTIAQLCRHLDINPELCAKDGNSKFLRRFAMVEKLARDAGKHLEDLTRDDLEKLWSQAKKK